MSQGHWQPIVFVPSESECCTSTASVKCSQTLVLCAYLRCSRTASTSWLTNVAGSQRRCSSGSLNPHICALTGAYITNVEWPKWCAPAAHSCQLLRKQVAKSKKHTKLISMQIIHWLSAIKMETPTVQEGKSLTLTCQKYAKELKIQCYLTDKLYKRQAMFYISHVLAYSDL